MNFLSYLVPFAVALGLLIIVHEAGHFFIARWCGVKVLRFSVGFGRPLLMRRFGRDATELAIGAFPLGGYVKMLDEREGEVSPAELPRAFNRQNVAKRFAIVLAGPTANFLLAIVLYWALFIHGVEELRPVLGAPVAQSTAERAGVEEGEVVRRVGEREIATWQELRWEILQRALEKGVVVVETINPRQEINVRHMDLSQLETADLEGDVLETIGLRFYRPVVAPIVAKVTTGSVAEAAGLQPNDRIASVNGEETPDWAKVVGLISRSPGREIALEFVRDGVSKTVRLTPAEVEDHGRRIGRIGMAVQDSGVARPELLTEVRYGVVEALGKAARQTWETSVFSLKMMGRMVVGELSWKNLSGPVTIADYAGQSARMGWSHYLRFLALISISLGVLNLLPIPLLDGGHLMYYIVEIIRGGPVSERVMEIGQQIGLALLVMLMAFAFYNDINRLISG